GDEGEGEVLVDGEQVDFDGQAGDGEQLLQLAGEVEDALVPDVVEGADAERIAEQRHPFSVPAGAGEGAVEVVEPRRRFAESFEEGGGGVGGGRGEGAGAGDEVEAVGVDAGRLAGPAAPPPVAEADGCGGGRGRPVAR